MFDFDFRISTEQALHDFTTPLAAIPGGSWYSQLAPLPCTFYKILRASWE